MTAPTVTPDPAVVPSLPGGWEGVVVGMMMGTLAIGAFCVGLLALRFALGGRDHTKSERLRYHAQRRNTLGIEVRGVARKLAAEGGGQRFVRFLGANALYGRNLRALTKDLRHERAFARYIVVVEVDRAAGRGVMVKVVPVRKAASPWRPAHPTQELRFRFGGFDFRLPGGMGRVSPAGPGKPAKVDEWPRPRFVPPRPGPVAVEATAATIASDGHADLIRGAAVRLIAAGGGVETVPTPAGSFAADTLVTVLDPVQAAADKASMIVRATKVDGGVQVEVHRELSQPEGIVHAAEGDLNAWESPNYPNGGQR